MLYQLSYLPRHSCTYVTITQRYRPCQRPCIASPRAPACSRDCRRDERIWTKFASPSSHCSAKMCLTVITGVAPADRPSNRNMSAVMQSRCPRRESARRDGAQGFGVRIAAIAAAAGAAASTGDDPAIGAISERAAAGGSVRGQPADDLPRPGDPGDRRASRVVYHPDRQGYQLGDDCLLQPPQLDEQRGARPADHEPLAASRPLRSLLPGRKALLTRSFTRFPRAFATGSPTSASCSRRSDRPRNLRQTGRRSTRRSRRAITPAARPASDIASTRRPDFDDELRALSAGDARRPVGPGRPFPWHCEYRLSGFRGSSGARRPARYAIPPGFRLEKFLEASASHGAILDGRSACDSRPSRTDWSATYPARARTINPRSLTERSSWS